MAPFAEMIEWIDAPSAMVLALVLTIFGYGQGLVMAPLLSAVLSTVKPVSAGAASHLRHDGADRERRRRRGDRRGILRTRIESVEPTGCLPHWCCLRCR
jgi:hypothetical protein